jgi:translation elongation factor EF-1alpha
MQTDVEQVLSWYNENLERLSRMFVQLSVRSFKPGDVIEGKVCIEVESPTVVGSVTFWNKGDVEVLRLDLPVDGRDPVVVDDRVRLHSEHIPPLLEKYFQSLTQGSTT